MTHRCEISSVIIIHNFIFNFFFFRDLLRKSPDLIQRIYEQILKECKKQSLNYRSVAIRVLSLLADQYNFQIYELFWTWFEKALKKPVNIFLFIIKYSFKYSFRIPMKRNQKR
jgi:hypothetical protein